MNEPQSKVQDGNGKARYIMIGGFLGAGKTTAVARLARQLVDDNLRVGLITNDQGNQLVDTATLASQGFPVEEIAGGCFCCRFNSLMDAAGKLSSENRPDVFIAEPVGSCTDLVATVSYPLRRIYGDDFTIAPLSVLVDPIRALRMFGLEDGGKFSPKVFYIYRKQLEEADIIVINKCDLLDSKRLALLRDAFAKDFSQAELFEVSARTGAGLSSWFDRIVGSGQAARAAMLIDYDVYAEGEALLGWLNCTVQLDGGKPFDGNKILSEIAEEIQKRLKAAAAEIAHLKMTLSPAEGLGEIAVVNLVRNDFVPELSQTLPDPLTEGQLIINLRAEASPDQLKSALDAALEICRKNHASLSITVEHLEHFRPGPPTPTHRDAVSP